MGANYRKELEAGVPGGSIPSGGGLNKMTDYLVNRKSGYSGIDVPATGEVKGKMYVVNPKEAGKKVAPLTKQEMRARDRANKEAQRKIGKEHRTTRWSKDANYDSDIPSELNFKKGGAVKSKSSASKRADGCAVRGKTRA